MNGQAVNDDPGLEKDADDMGAKAMEVGKETSNQQPLQRKALSSDANTAQQVAQLKVVDYSNTARNKQKQDNNNDDNVKQPPAEEHEEAMLKIAHMISDIVEASRPQAINWKLFKDDKAGYLKNWYKQANRYVVEKEESKVLYAAFGYAIETLTNQKLGSKYEGYTLHKQVSKGHTRPDIVLKLKGETIAWMDITSDKSEGHIYKKEDPTWNTLKYVYEITYKKLELAEIVAGAGNPMHAEFFKIHGEQKEVLRDERDKIDSKAKKALIDLKNTDLKRKPNERFWMTGVGNRGTKQTKTREWLEEKAKVEFKNYGWKQQLKGMLLRLKMDPGPFGFSNKGTTKIKVRSDGYRDSTEAKAEKAAAPKQEAIRRKHLVRLSTELKKFEGFKIVKSLFEKYGNRDSADKLKPDPGLVNECLLIKHACETFKDLSTLEEKFLNVKDFKPGRELCDKADALFSKFPQKYDLKKIKIWQQKASDLVNIGKLVKKANTIWRAFQKYSIAKGNEGWSDKMMKIVADKLHVYPKDDSAIKAAIEYMQKNPVKKIKKVKMIDMTVDKGDENDNNKISNNDDQDIADVSKQNDNDTEMKEDENYDDDADMDMDN
ncbi:MAG: hypothetical protein AAF570_15750 [Bacteroidota bacterium]